MNSSLPFEVAALEKFDKQAERLVKKYASLKEELAALVSELKQNPTKGIPLRHSCFKIRLAIASKGKGKSGGARVITHIKVVKNRVYLLTIYDKSEQDTIAERKIDDLIAGIKQG
jgi:mRNA-degrading endonuclease RelE of RelBE toxin-antitoxin system